MHLPDGIHHAETGAVCVTALFDKDDIVRAIRAERVFDFFEAEIFRRVVTQRYGPVASAQTLADSYELGWGPAVDPGVAFGARNTLMARYEATQDFISRGSNGIPQIRVVFSLVDSQWAASRPQ